MIAHATVQSPFHWLQLARAVGLVLLVGCSASESRLCGSGTAPPEGARNDAGPTSSVDGGSSEDGEATSSATSSWATWPMPNPANVNLPNAARYTVSMVGADEVVQDEVTGLVWQRAVGAQGVSWRDARSYCSALTLAGHDDWRLPSRIELISLIDFTRSMEMSSPSPAIDTAAFPATGGDWFWSSSLKADDPESAWYVYFYFGYIDVDAVRNAFNARCVRGGAEPGSDAQARYELQPQTVRDRGTGLTWQRAAPEGQLNFAAAAAYCADLVLSDASDWRAPTMKELQTIVDERRHDPALPPDVFADASSERFWTSSVWAANASLAWYAELAAGSGLYGIADNPYRVRCVR